MCSSDMGQIMRYNGTEARIFLFHVVDLQTLLL